MGAKSSSFLGAIQMMPFFCVSILEYKAATLTVSRPLEWSECGLRGLLGQADGLICASGLPLHAVFQGYEGTSRTISPQVACLLQSSDANTNTPIQWKEVSLLQAPTLFVCCFVCWRVREDIQEWIRAGQDTFPQGSRKLYRLLETISRLMANETRPLWTAAGKLGKRREGAKGTKVHMAASRETRQQRGLQLLANQTASSPRHFRGYFLTSSLGDHSHPPTIRTPYSTHFANKVLLEERTKEKHKTRVAR